MIGVRDDKVISVIQYTLSVHTRHTKVVQPVVCHRWALPGFHSLHCTEGAFDRTGTNWRSRWLLQYWGRTDVEARSMLFLMGPHFFAPHLVPRDGLFLEDVDDVKALEFFGEGSELGTAQVLHFFLDAAGEV